METKKKYSEKIKPHLIYILLLLVLHLFVFRNFLVLDDAIYHDIIAYTARTQILINSVEMYNDFFPLWNPHYFSGTPLAPRLYLFFDYPFPAWLALFLPAIVAVKLSYLLDIFLAGIFMYILIFYLTKNKIASFIFLDKL